MDFKTTLLLPKTDFPMRADLAKREPAWLARWAAEPVESPTKGVPATGQYARILSQRESEGATPYILHDGPPYPTGAIHYGTLLNKVLKDVIVRSRLMMGYAARFVPGWDCHGLPIEQQVEKQVGSKDKLGPVLFREKCEAHARKFVDVMRTEFKRAGCVGLWDTPYLTLSHEYESAIVKVLGDFARTNLLYRAKRPVHWCSFHRTALAEAEVEYADKNSPSIYVRFPLLPGQEPVRAAFGDAPASLVIWTTTPWTLAANLAVVANAQLEYVGIPIERPGGREYLIVAQGRAEAFIAACGLSAPPPSEWKQLSGATLSAWKGVRYQHPFIDVPRSDLDFRLHFAAHATLEAGTGLVHTAPGHGAEDYIVGLEAKLAIYAPVDHAGCYTKEVSQWQGRNVLEANGDVVLALNDAGVLLNKVGESIKHSYPHCWRCKRPVIFRATTQWFARLGALGDPQSLRQKALDEIDRTQWLPAWGRDRIRGMIEVRPDWCLSRQRVWGVPIPALRCRACAGNDPDNAFLDLKVTEHVSRLFAEKGSNTWFERELADLIPPGIACPSCKSTDLEKTQDIVDVWFESGVSWAAVADGRLVPPGEKVDLYLEGADQHRGWFHSSLLAAVASRGTAPYKAVLTHGWVLDDKGKVYSKSTIEADRAAGKETAYVDPIKMMDTVGAELLRLWAAAADYQGDVVYSKTILDQLSESYRKIRNTSRFLLSVLPDFKPARDSLTDDRLRELDLMVLGLVRERDHQIFEAYRNYSFHDAVRLIVDFVVNISAEYLDAVKDALYCEAPDSLTRRSVQTALNEMLRSLATWMAPILCFTAQEVADELSRTSGEPFDVHGDLWRPHMPVGRSLSSPNKRWTDEVRPRRQAILRKLEAFRAAGHKSLQARVSIVPAAAERPHWEWNLNHLEELCVVSAMSLSETDAPGETQISIDEAPGPECPRCWRRTGSAANHASYPDVCRRCAAVLDTLPSPPV